ncbi:hypothetical protein DL766_010315 [Monosporascus sp. MC13-8B]|uniref:Uncharacterized protein n=1 Tax=Monosporascus cannonballus TaxID=155416 RepID=A0ABY0HC28_9PEZI|nr:hypothetical protein DL763_006460 [Monosporascus cannonballus]RYO89145.1 hypothetical protein DL762_003425 [Monosporascus cannonballus]RYP02488.1 hypothetical protein DL766_010315 [Monosporascus sp. MC13-8B]
MSLARALTARRSKQPSTDMGIMPQRSNTVKGHAYSGSIRHKISSPVELTHTTNMLAYNAPDLYPQSASSTTSRSDDESESPRTSSSSAPTSPDISSVDDRSELPGTNHLSCYFTVPGQKLPAIDSEPPVIPKRSPSHTKQASFERLMNRPPRPPHQSGNSVSTKASFGLSRSSSTPTKAPAASASLSRKGSISSLPSTSSFTSPVATRSSPSHRKAAGRIENKHPFGPELAQVTEIAEDYGVKEKLSVIDEEEQELISRGLYRFRPEDYLSEIQGLFSTFFRSEPTTQVQEPVWI